MMTPQREVTDARPTGLPWATERWSALKLAEYRACLVAAWIPALGPVRAQLEKGALVAIPGCGRGAAAILLAEAFPRSHIFAYDGDAPSVACAHAAAARAGVGERITYEVATAQAMPRLEEAGGYDLIAFFDQVRTLADPRPAFRRAFESLAPDGVVLVVEPTVSPPSAARQGGAELTGDAPAPVGRARPTRSPLMIAASSHAEAVPTPNQPASEARLRALFADVGYSRVRCVAETRLRRVFEVRK